MPLCYIRVLRPAQPQRQSWLTFLHNHASAIWTCDLLQTYDILFPPAAARAPLPRRSRYARCFASNTARIDADRSVTAAAA
ncbi:MAG: hypothetical protein Kow00120_13640 [Anaerolineae bacterium]